MIVLSRIKSIRKIGVIPTFDMEVETDHSYIANGIVVHNSENPNMQNFPASNEVRNIIIPRPGYSFIDRDFSQAELRVAAEYSMDDAMLKAFRDNADPHWDAVMEFFGIKFPYRPEKIDGKYLDKTIEDVKDFISKTKDLSALSTEAMYEEIIKQIKEWDSLRAMIKTIVFGVLYGAGPHAIAQQLYPGKFDYYDEEKKQATLDECQSLIDKWFASKPKVKQWIESVHEFQKQHRFVETMFGRRRYLLFTNSNYWKFSSAALREGPNTKIQSTASDMCCMAAIYLQREINKYPEDDCRIINIVHDNIILEAPDARIAFWDDIMKDCMEVKANVLKHVKMQTSTQITKKWEK